MQTHPTHVASNKDTVNWCMAVWCTQNLCLYSSSFTQKVKESKKRLDKKIKYEKQRYASKVEDDFPQCNARQCWKNSEVITGYKQRKKAPLCTVSKFSLTGSTPSTVNSTSGTSALTS